MTKKAPLSLFESAQVAAKSFQLFSDEEPELVPLGIRAVDDVIGGLFPGACGILGADTGIGKSSLMLESLINHPGTPGPPGLISLEDGPDVLGSRALSYASGVNSLRIRKKAFYTGDKEALEAGLDRLKSFDDVYIHYAIGGREEDVVAGVEALAERGCRLIWFDYVQKSRGKTGNPRTDVGSVYTAFQRACAEHNVAGMVISQLSRAGSSNYCSKCKERETVRKPTVKSLKESGDLENEARLIILAYRDPDKWHRVNCFIAKSTYGGENTEFAYERDPQRGVLVEVRLEEDF